MKLTAMMTIGQAAKAAGVTTKAVLLDEAKGLLPPGRAFPGRLSPLRPLRRRDADVHPPRPPLGLHLDGISAILAARSNGNPPCPTVRAMLEDRITEIDQTILDLRALRTALANTRASADLASSECHDQPPVVWAIIER
ncbi:MAG: MerR family DNA-binding protein [Actinobacteria bacterium]|nr:MerR family DNA-binding protein [Actinomycetota bacterium]